VTDPIVIVGAGPAGATAALLLARAGAPVVIVERRPFPRPKPCGDCLSPGLTPLLQRMGVLDRVLALAPARLAGWRLAAPGAASRTAFADGAEALALPREKLDAALLDAALEAGAGLVRGRFAGVRRNGALSLELAGRRGRLRAAFLVGADGLRSVVARRIHAIRRAPRIRKVSFTAHVRGVPDAGDWGEMHVARGLCAGLAPVGPAGPDRLWNLTVVLDRARRPPPGSRPDPPALLAMLAVFPELAARLRDASFERHGDAGPLLASGPFDWPVRSAAAPGVALVGDAAGYFDPFTGQGIFQAVAGASLLAEEILAGGPGPDTTLRRYAARQRRLAAEPRMLQHLIEAVMSRPALATAAIRRLDAAPAFARRVLAATGDLAPPRSLLSPGPLCTFLLPTSAKEASP
jgi:menaquinone-9 beta-reductase